jgi:dimethylhistidine N-methyltransferase
LQGSPRVGFFPGSTIGNFAPDEAAHLLRGIARQLGRAAHLILGVDLPKDRARLEAAYDDAAGVTAAFNLNLLARINRELGANFDTGHFLHKAIWNESDSRIEMHLVSDRVQSVEALGKTFRFMRGETIHTENSYKYAIGRLVELAESAGFRVVQTWTDAEKLFSVHKLIVA